MYTFHIEMLNEQLTKCTVYLSLVIFGSASMIVLSNIWYSKYYCL